MAKHKAATLGNERSVGKSGSGVQGGGIQKKNKKAYKGLAFLDRGQTDYRSDKKDIAKKKLYVEMKRKTAYAKMLQKEGYKPLEFPEVKEEDEEDQVDKAVVPAASKSKKAAKNAGKEQIKKTQKETESASDMDEDDDSEEGDEDLFEGMSTDEMDECDISDEDVDDNAIMFKDEKVQKLWSGQEVPKKNKTASAQAKHNNKGKVVAQREMFEVPDWGSDAPAKPAGGEAKKKQGSAGKDVENDAWVTVKGKTKNKKPNPFGKVAHEASERKRAEEEERIKQREEAEKAKEGRQAYFAGRKKERALHLKKTAKGQPVMKNVIEGMLAKLQKDS